MKKNKMMLPAQPGERTFNSAKGFFGWIASRLPNSTSEAVPAAEISVVSNIEAGFGTFSIAFRSAIKDYSHEHLEKCGLTEEQVLYYIENAKVLDTTAFLVKSENGLSVAVIGNCLSGKKSIDYYPGITAQYDINRHWDWTFVFLNI